MGVLGGTDIQKMLPEIFAKGSDPGMVRAAKYYLTLGDRLLILPKGKRFYEKTGSPRTRPFTLEPGETTMVSTREYFSMPFHLAGIFGPTSSLSNLGIFFFGGMLVDPGFGRLPSNEIDPVPLTFYLANVGATSIQLRPGSDAIASIAFLPVCEIEGAEINLVSANSFADGRTSPGAKMRKMRDEIFESEEPPGRALGQVEDVAEIGRRVDQVEASVNQVVLFGVILLATTLVAAMMSLSLEKTMVEPISWLEATKAVGIVIVEIGALVTFFYISVRGVARWRRTRKRRSLPPA